MGAEADGVVLIADCQRSKQQRCYKTDVRIRIAALIDVAVRGDEGACLQHEAQGRNFRNAVLQFTLKNFRRPLASVQSWPMGTEVGLFVHFHSQNPYLIIRFSELKDVYPACRLLVRRMESNYH